MSQFITSFTQTRELTPTELLEGVISETQTRYRSRVIEMENSHKYRVGRNYYTSLLEAQKAVDLSIQSLANSINRIR